MGGTAGLFLGASLLTFVELVYYACRKPSYKLLQEQEAQQRRQALQEAKRKAEQARGWGRLAEGHRTAAMVRHVQPALQPVPALTDYGNLPARKVYASAFSQRKPAQDPFDLHM